MDQPGEQPSVVPLGAEGRLDHGRRIPHLRAHGDGRRALLG